jgi:RNA polymerase sigma-70 factor (ECF subfamily)
MLAAWEELTAPEIAVVLDISTSVAEQRLHRAKRRFAKKMERSGPPSDSHFRAAPHEGEL